METTTIIYAFVYSPLSRVKYCLMSQPTWRKVSTWLCWDISVGNIAGVAKYYVRYCVSYFSSNDAHRYSCVISFSPGFQIICYSFAGFRKCSWDILGRTRLDETYTQESTHIKKQTKVNALESKISCFCGLSPVRIVSDSPKGLNLLAELLQDISEILSTCWDTWLTDGPLLNWKSSEMRRWMKADRRWIGFE